MTFILFLLFFTFKSLRDQYNHDVERKVDSFQNKIFVNEDIQKSYFKIKFRKRNKSPTCTFLQVDHLRNRQTRRILCLRAYYLGDSVITVIRLANSRWYWKSDGQASYSRLIPLIFISAHEFQFCSQQLGLCRTCSETTLLFFSLRGSCVIFLQILFLVRKFEFKSYNLCMVICWQ